MEPMTNFSNEICLLSHSQNLLFNPMPWVTKGDQDLEPHIEEIDFNIKARADYSDGDFVWDVQSNELDSIFSLWMSSFLTEPESDMEDKHNSSDWFMKKASSTVEYRRILGENPEAMYSSYPSSSLRRKSKQGLDSPKQHGVSVTAESGKEKALKPLQRLNTDILTRDLKWWSNDLRPIKSRIDEPSLITIGFNGPNEGEVISITSNAPRSTIIAQHIFSGFMWAVAHLVQKDSFRHIAVEDQESFVPVEFDKTWSFPTLRNNHLMSIVRQIAALGLGTMEGIFLCMIPPLSYYGKLPSEEMMELLRKAKELEKQHDWDAATDIYRNILDLNINPRKSERITYFVVVELIEFLFIANEAVLDRKNKAITETASPNAQASSLIAGLESIRVELER
ncbi:hypothetical protein BS50DRAFT_665888 [Corynespora cassiicola Philippines]|uniref:Uncharacterized protein n=1 Tax=Corynespora cassiicola Philippines TaxID=1448308 RepID=A0A2T2NS81_CORCC|nr:hypothetical protein BS50DRAFT_665888 [Corynespora cassiicola Philippines]